jgi:hypothetical protein
MKQVIRRGLKEIIVDEVPDPVASTNHVLVRPFYSLISSGTETADIHKEGIVKEVAENPSHLKKVYDVMMKTNPIGTVREVRAKFSDYAVLGYAARASSSINTIASRIWQSVSASLMGAREPDTAKPLTLGAILRREFPTACLSSTRVSRRSARLR